MLDRARDLHLELPLAGELVDAGEPDLGGFQFHPVGWFLPVNLDDSEHLDANGIRDLLAKERPRSSRVWVCLWLRLARSLSRSFERVGGQNVLLSSECLRDRSLEVVEPGSLVQP